MDEQKQEFRVGMMAVVALAAAVVMVFKFGDIGSEWKSGTTIGIVLANASGVSPQAPIRMSGIQIGHVKSMKLVAEGRGVLVDAHIDSEHTFRDDSIAQVSRSLLGDGAIEILPGTQGQPIATGTRIAGRSVSDPMEMAAKMEQRLSTTLTTFEQTGRQWGQLANSLNSMMAQTGEDGISTVERSAMALEQFTRTMKTAEETLAAAGTLISDPQYQQQLQATLTALPELLTETRNTLRTVNQVVGQVNTTVANINVATTPLAQQSQSMVNRLNQSLGNIESITSELAVVSKQMNDNDGTIKKLLTDPTVYRNLNATSASLAQLLQNLQPVIADMQIFSDKVARHPEVLGLRGVVRGSSGTKEGSVVPASFEN